MKHTESILVDPLDGANQGEARLRPCGRSVRYRRLRRLLIGMLTGIFLLGFTVLQAQETTGPEKGADEAAQAQLVAESAEAADQEAEEVPMATLEALEQVQRNADLLWTLVAAFLVFLMQGGFAMVEAGFTRAKNAVNICMKNLMDCSVGPSPTGRLALV